jgi:hypothetical protein
MIWTDFKESKIRSALEEGNFSDNDDDDDDDAILSKLRIAEAKETCSDKEQPLSYKVIYILILLIVYM